MADKVYCMYCVHFRRRDELCNTLPNLASSIESPISPPMQTEEYVSVHDRNKSNNCPYYTAITPVSPKKNKEEKPKDKEF